MESKSSWFFRIKWGLVAGKIRGKEVFFFFFWGGGGGEFLLL